MTEPPAMQPFHYQVLCGLAVGAMALVLVQQGIPLLAVAVLLLGLAPVTLKVRLSPVLLVVLLVGGLLFQRYVFTSWYAHRLLEPEDVLLCTATLAYVAGHYRLLAIWSHILPPDPRQRVGWQQPRQARPAALLSRGELTWFVLQLPLFALAAQGVWMALGVRRQIQELPVRWVEVVQLAWGLAVVLFVAGLFFRYWRWRTMDRTTAQVLLQDVLWHETRGEQRRLARWLAWWRLTRLRVRGNVRGEK